MLFLCCVIIIFISLLIISHCFPRLIFVVFIFLEKPEIASVSKKQSDLFNFFHAQVCVLFPPIFLGEELNAQTGQFVSGIIRTPVHRRIYNKNIFFEIGFLHGFIEV